jgi:hypothetical protein
MRQYPISAHQLSGLQRKVAVCYLGFDFETQEVHFFYIVYYYNAQGASIDSFKEPLKGKKLTATNATKVNAQGDYLQPDDEGNYPEGAIGEYDFWLAFTQSGTFNYDSVFENVIEKADEYKRFD